MIFATRSARSSWRQSNKKRALFWGSRWCRMRKFTERNRGVKTRGVAAAMCVTTSQDFYLHALFQLLLLLHERLLVGKKNTWTTKLRKQFEEKCQKCLRGSRALKPHLTPQPKLVWGTCSAQRGLLLPFPSHLCARHQVSKNMLINLQEPMPTNPNRWTDRLNFVTHCLPESARSMGQIIAPSESFIIAMATQTTRNVLHLFL